MIHAYDITSAARSASRRITLRHVRKNRSADETGHGVLEPTIQAARAYDHVGYDYLQYADGDDATGAAQDANRRYEHGDGIVWKELRASLDRLQQLGVSHVRALDAGCGPGTWTRRIAGYAEEIGIHLSILGVDISTTQLEIARNAARNSRRPPKTIRPSTIEFEECDLSKALPWKDRYFDLVLCNYTVLNHVAKTALPDTIKELCRVSCGDVIATLRAIGSPPTACVIGMERVREYRHDKDEGALTFTLDDASHHILPFTMYTAEALKAMFLAHAKVRELRAIDIFAGRFAANSNWTADLLEDLPQRRAVLDRLEKLEEDLCRQPGWIDHGTHVLIVARSRSLRALGPRHVLKPVSDRS